MLIITPFHEDELYLRNSKYDKKMYMYILKQEGITSMDE